MYYTKQIKFKTNWLPVLLLHLRLLNLQTIEAQATLNTNPVRIDAKISQLKLSNFTYVKNGSFWECKITCTGNISFNGKKEAKNARIDYGYKFMSPSSGLDNNYKTISDRINIAKIIPGELNSFVRVINFKIPVATNNTSYPDPEIYLCNDIITAKLSRVKGDTNPNNNLKTWNGQNCVD